MTFIVHLHSLFAAARFRIRRLADKYPALILLAGLLNGLLPLTTMPVRPAAETVLYCLPALLFVWLLPKAKACAFVIMTVAGSAAVAIYLRTLDDDFLAIIGERDCGAAAMVRITDASCGGNELPWLQNPPLTRAEVVQILRNGEQEWRTTSGRVALALPKTFKQVNYGDLLQIRGVFRKINATAIEHRSVVFPERDGRPPECQTLSGVMPGGFDLQRYLLARGITRVCRVADAVAVSGAERFTVFGKLLEWRNRLVAAAAAKMNKAEAKSMLAILLFGYRQGLDDETRNSFIRSGTIHIFSVSGLHVAVLAAMALWLLRPLSFRARYLLLPPLMLAYVAATGMQAPAVRSLLMISLWAVCRAFLYYTPSLNVVLLAAVIILGVNPFYVTDIGVQYSFTIVIFLLASGESLAAWCGLPEEKNRWTPPARRSWFEVWRRQKLAVFAGIAASCMVAWLVSSGISLYYQGIYFPLSVLANFIIIPFVSILYVLVFVKIIFMPLTFMNELTGKIIELTLDGMSGICAFFYHHFENAAMIKPPWWSLLLFYAALLLLITSQRKKILLTALIAIGAVLLFWHAAPRLLGPEIMILHGGGSQIPAAVICPPGGKGVAVINAPSPEAAQAIVNILRVRGVTRVERLMFTDSRKEACAGAPFLLAAMDVSQIIPEKNVARGAFLASLLKACSTEKTAVCWPGPENWYAAGREMELAVKNNGWTFEYAPGNFNIKLQVAEIQPGAATVTLKVAGYGEISTPILNSSVLEMRKYVFK